MLKYIGDFERLKDFGFEDATIYSNKYKGYLWDRGNHNIVQIKIDNNNCLHFQGITKRIIYIIYDLIKAGLVEKVEE